MPTAANPTSDINPSTAATRPIIVADHYEIEQSAVLAIRAGCDALLTCHDTELQERARRALSTKAEADPDFRVRCQQAFGRFVAARRRFPPRPAADAAAVDQILATSGAAELLGEIRERSG